MGYIKRTPLTEYRQQRRGGRGSRGSVTRDEDFLEHTFIVDFFGITGDLYNTPRTYGVSGTYRF